MICNVLITMSVSFAASTHVASMIRTKRSSGPHALRHIVSPLGSPFSRHSCTWRAASPWRGVPVFVARERERAAGWRSARGRAPAHGTALLDRDGARLSLDCRPRSNLCARVRSHTTRCSIEAASRARRRTCRGCRTRVRRVEELLQRTAPRTCSSTVLGARYGSTAQNSCSSSRA